MDHDAQQLVARLTRAGESVTTAESCTGGMIAAAITSVPGSSAVFPGAIVSYANEIKQALLRVPAADLAAHGAVSEQVVRAMAQGAREQFGTTYAVAVSGIAGPDGGTAEKPVGLVWIAVATPGGVTAWKHLFEGNRDNVRGQATKAALAHLLDSSG
jgi:nicotinamide-nucleotide amidase